MHSMMHAHKPLGTLYRETQTKSLGRKKGSHSFYILLELPTTTMVRMVARGFEIQKGSLMHALVKVSASRWKLAS